MHTIEIFEGEVINYATPYKIVKIFHCSPYQFILTPSLIYLYNPGLDGLESIYPCKLTYYFKSKKDLVEGITRYYEVNDDIESFSEAEYHDYIIIPEIRLLSYKKEG